MSKLSKREKVLLVVLLVALSGLLYYNFVLKSFISEYNALDTEITNTQMLVQDYKLKDASVQMIDERLEKLHDEIDGDLDRVLEGIDRAEILRMLEGTVGSICEAPEYLFPAGHVTLKENAVTTVEVSCTCSEEQLRSILGKLNETDYINRVSVASFRVSDVNTGIGNARISIDLLTLGVEPPAD